MSYVVFLLNKLLAVFMDPWDKHQIPSTKSQINPNESSPKSSNKIIWSFEMGALNLFGF